MSGTTSMQGRELGAEETRRNTHKVKHCTICAPGTLLSELCWGEGQTLRLSHQQERRFQTMSKESDGPQGLQSKETPKLTPPPEPVDQEGIKTFPSADGVSAQWTQRFPLHHHGYHLDLRELAKTSLTLQEDENWQKKGYFCIKFGILF